MLFKTIIEGRFKAFSRMKEEERTRNIGVVKYIENLASMAGVDIFQWDAKAIFGTGTGNKFIDDKNEINRRFFEEVDKLAVANPDKTVTDLLNDEMKAHIKRAETQHVTNLIAKEQQSAENQLYEAMNYYSNYEKYLKKAGEHFASVRRLSNSPTTIEDQVRKIHGSTFWQFHAVTGNSKIEFVTRADVVVTHKNPSAGVNISINFGRFKAVFDMNGFSLQCLPHERNIAVNGYPHPHIQNRGGICWGTAATTATKQLAQCNFVDPLILLATVLTSYNSGSPYVTMERFQEHIGLPEEIMARDEMNRLRDQSQARFPLIDASTVDVDRRRNIPTPAPTPETNPVPPLDIAAMDEALAQRIVHVPVDTTPLPMPAAATDIQF